ncbi:MAG: putative toxin-antitoxin system toxin component, PIN family [Vicinamibacterales bacterium]
MRVVIDPNVLVSAAISSTGPPRAIITSWTDERFELVISPALIEELRGVLHRSKLRRWISLDLADEFIDGLAQDATIVGDPPTLPSLSRDPDDDYLIALARATRADYLISGDRDLLDLEDPDPPILSPRQFAELLDQS